MIKSKPFTYTVTALIVALATVMVLDMPLQNSIHIEKATPETLSKHEVFSWQTWEKEPSKFVWQFAETERAYILEGKALLRAEGSHEVRVLQKGDFVTFAPGLRCHWHVVEPFKKHVTHEDDLLRTVYWKVAFKVKTIPRFIKEILS